MFQVQPSRHSLIFKSPPRRQYKHHLSPLPQAPQHWPIIEPSSEGSQLPIQLGQLHFTQTFPSFKVSSPSRPTPTQSSSLQLRPCTVSPDYSPPFGEGSCSILHTWFGICMLLCRLPSSFAFLILLICAFIFFQSEIRDAASNFAYGGLECVSVFLVGVECS